MRRLWALVSLALLVGATASATVIKSQGSKQASSAPTAPVVASGSCTNSVSCWPNASDTGYQNAPNYPGTPGVADPSKLTPASANSTTCPTSNFQSNHTYQGCVWNGGVTIGSPSGHVTNVHFVGDLFELTDPSSALILLFCDSGCSFEYDTMKPAALSSPNLSPHGVTYKDSYGGVCECGTGAFNSVMHGTTWSHDDIWGFDTGIILGGANTPSTPDVFQDNWLHDEGDCDDDPSCTTHDDGIGMVDTGDTTSYVTLDHNNMPFVEDNTNDIAFQSGTYDHLTITNNLLSGDGYTVAIWSTSTNVTFTGNVMTNYGQQLFGWLYPQDFWDTPGSVWAHNKFLWDPSGVSPYFENGPGLGESDPITAADSGKCWVPSGLSTTDYGGGAC